MKNRVELHCHTKMTEMEGVADVYELILKARKMGIPAIAITDKNTVRAFPEAYHAWEMIDREHEDDKQDLFKVLYGMEACLVDDHSEKNYYMTKRVAGHKIIIIATSGEGVKNLYKLISEVSFESFDSFLKIPKSLLAEKRNGLIVGSCAQEGDVSDAVFHNDSDDNIRELVKFYDFVEVEPAGNYIYELGLSPKGDEISAEEIQEKLKRLARLCEEEEVPVIASANVYYVEKSDIEAFKVLRYSVGFSETPGWKAKHHLMSAEDLIAEFDFLGKETSERIVINNPNHIVEKIGALKPISSKKQYPVYPDADQVLKKLCYDKAHELYGNNLPNEVEDRMEYEYAALRGNGYTSLYMIAHELVKRSNEAGYLVGARGCSCASLISYLAGITEINPLPPHYICKTCGNSCFDVSDIKGFQLGDIGLDLPDKKCPVCGKKMSKDGYDIPVETFLGFNMDKEPDFDFNFSGEYQEEAQRNVASIKGVGTILRAGTIESLSEISALSYAKTYFKEKKSKRKQESIRKVAKRIVGVKRRDGVHPGGIIVVPKGVEESEYTPVLPSLFDPIADPIPRTEIEFHAIDGKLLKLDILGHSGPTFLKRLKERTGVDPRSIPTDDKGVISLLSDTKAMGIEPEQIGGIGVGTLGIPSFGDGFAIRLISDTKPQKLSDLIRIMGLCHGTGVWHGTAETVIKEGKADLAHCLCNRDDIMIYLIGKGLDPALSFKIMESVRKGVIARGKCRSWEEWKREMAEHGVSDWYIECCEKIQYMFPKAHSAAYTLTAYRLLYYKLHYPEAFYRTWLEFAVIDKSFIDNGPDYARNVLEELKKKDPGKLGHKQQRMLDEIPVALEMFARGFSSI